MAIKQIVDDALKNSMSRKEFLGQVGTLFLTVIGVTSVLHVLGGNKELTHSLDAGYGSAVYGGGKDTR